MPTEKNSLTSLPSSKRYKWLDERYYGKGDVTKCDEFYKKEGDDVNPLHIFCLKLIGNLQNYEHLEFLHVFPKSTCKYLNLWVYEYLTRIYRDMSGAEARSTITKIIPIWTKFNLKDDCKLEFISFIGYDNYENMKKLYDYVLNYKYFQLYSINKSVVCTTEEDQYIKDAITLYEKVKEDCRTDREEKKYCVVLDDIDQVYPNGQLSTLECHEIKDSLSDPNVETESEPHLAGNSLRGQDHAPGIDGIESASTNASSDNVVAGIFPVLGIPLISFVLYKFTPFGTWFKNRLQRNKIIEYNIHEDSSHELSENGFLHSNDESESFINHIGYLPSDIN
ncbi:PIR Superfamily Protein [Plasmodium ovale wallikeri]|uniref:PIR Superfamily Protein n=2 Tax=Plasmodium ovale TaxID=36330 RepID=A0A1A9ARL3_PLAOA|nr:PIR Superfamily Protein [Plasmodium ovale wallikeri]SBT58809.1 PIR Superfamily Protein [Plasmodium ovale wallikeri]SBT73548.1 PIR protein [Plasmodium ovale]